MAVLIPQTVTEDRAAGIVIPGALKFNKGRNEYLYKNTGASSSDGNRKTWTLSIWVKRSTTSHGSSGSDKQMFWSHGSGSNGEGFLRISYANTIENLKIFLKCLKDFIYE